MGEVPIRELNQDTASVLRRVKQGEEITVTERGSVIARLVPAQQAAHSALLASGRFHPPAVGGPVPRPPGPVRTDREAGQFVRELRDEERY
jgi:prevent-host-death family protein